MESSLEAHYRDKALEHKEMQQCTDRAKKMLPRQREILTKANSRGLAMCNYMLMHQVLAEIKELKR